MVRNTGHGGGHLTQIHHQVVHAISRVFVAVSTYCDRDLLRLTTTVQIFDGRRSSAAETICSQTVRNRTCRGSHLHNYCKFLTDETSRITEIGVLFRFVSSQAEKCHDSRHINIFKLLVYPVVDRVSRSSR